jgi:hypothetical protein
MSTVCALYVVKAGRSRIQVRDGYFGADTTGDAGWLEGREGPPSLRGTKRSKAVGIRMIRERMIGLSAAKSVTDKRRGSTRRIHERPRFDVGLLEGVCMGLSRVIPRTSTL